MTDLHQVIPPAVGDSSVRRISNSEVGTWLSCRAKYRFAHDLNLEPKRYGTALSRGIAGHEILADYYEMLKQGVSHDEAVKQAVILLGRMLALDSITTELAMELRTILDNYWSYYQGDDNWEILFVEEPFDIPLTDEFAMPMRLDLLVKERTSGKIYLVDHKFYYDFPNQDILSLNVQFPKYVGALRYNGINVDGCILNVLRTRKMKSPEFDSLFKRFVTVPSSAKITNSIRGHIRACQEITEYRSLPENLRKEQALPILNSYVCKGCSFINLCMSEFDGGDITFQIQTDFRENTYDYNKESTDD